MSDSTEKLISDVCSCTSDGNDYMAVTVDIHKENGIVSMPQYMRELHIKKGATLKSVENLLGMKYVGTYDGKPRFMILQEAAPEVKMEKSEKPEKPEKPEKQGKSEKKGLKRLVTIRRDKKEKKEKRNSVKKEDLDKEEKKERRNSIKKEDDKVEKEEPVKEEPIKLQERGDNIVKEELMEYSTAFQVQQANEKSD